MLTLKKQNSNNNYICIKSMEVENKFGVISNHKPKLK